MKDIGPTKGTFIGSTSNKEDNLDLNLLNPHWSSHSWGKYPI